MYISNVVGNGDITFNNNVVTINIVRVHTLCYNSIA